MKELKSNTCYKTWGERDTHTFIPLFKNKPRLVVNKTKDNKSRMYYGGKRLMYISIMPLTHHLK